MFIVDESSKSFPLSLIVGGWHGWDHSCRARRAACGVCAVWCGSGQHERERSGGVGCGGQRERWCCGEYVAATQLVIVSITVTNTALGYKIYIPNIDNRSDWMRDTAQRDSDQSMRLCIAIRYENIRLAVSRF